MIPFGEHTMEVVGHGIYKNENLKPYIGVTFRHESGEECSTQVWITEKAAGMAKKALKKLGFDISDMTKMGKLNEDHSYLAGNSCLVNVWEDDYGGKLRTKYDIVLRDDPVENDEIASLGAMLSGGTPKKVAPAAPKAPRSPRTSSSKPGALNAEAAAEAKANADSDEPF